MSHRDHKSTTRESFQRKLEELRLRVDLLPEEQCPHLHKWTNAAEERHQQRPVNGAGIREMLDELRLIEKCVKSVVQVTRREARVARRHRRSEEAGN